MKKVLITGANSYIGSSFENYVRENIEEIQINTLDMKNEAWKQADFQKYDAIFHVAGIAHADTGKVSEEQKQLYYKVNTELTIACAKKAKEEGVRQFIFMSSIIVYGNSADFGKKFVIDRNTPLAPLNFYGDSKVKAEEGLKDLENENFKVVILRPPMIYGKGSKGNYPLLAKMAQRLPVFPWVENQRSMLYIGNLCKFVSLMILNEEAGTFYPQNKEYVQTSEMVKLIAYYHNKKICMIKAFRPILKILSRSRGKIGSMVNKAFGNMVYDMEMSRYKQEYQVYGLEESLRKTEEN